MSRIADYPAARELTNLHRRRTELAAHLVDLGHEVTRMVDAARDVNLDDEHDPEGCTIAFERSQLLQFAADAARELAEVEDAVARLADGRYGYCQRCAGRIGAERLSARPSTRWCISCARGVSGRR